MSRGKFLRDPKSLEAQPKKAHYFFKNTMLNQTLTLSCCLGFCPYYLFPY